MLNNKMFWWASHSSSSWEVFWFWWLVETEADIESVQGRALELSFTGIFAGHLKTSKMSSIKSWYQWRKIMYNPIDAFFNSLYLPIWIWMGFIIYSFSADSEDGIFSGSYHKLVIGLHAYSLLIFYWRNESKILIYFRDIFRCWLMLWLR